MSIKPKKHLGQHFLKDKNIAEKISSYLSPEVKNILEIGPGTGILTQYLHLKNAQLTVIDLDEESIIFLENQYKGKSINIIFGDFLTQNLPEIYDENFAVIGNFPYNISTQIMFKVLEHRKYIPEVVGMFQKEVAERICAKEGSKVYGILSVLMQAYYKTEYLFTVNENSFYPPPKVKSGVIKLSHYQTSIGNDDLLFKIVKSAFNQRRKKISNSLKSLNIDLSGLPYLDLRPEQLSVNQFIELTELINQKSAI